MTEEEAHGCVESLIGGHSQHDEGIAPDCCHIDGQKEGEGEEVQVLQIPKARWDQPGGLVLAVTPGLLPLLVWTPQKIGR